MKNTLKQTNILTTLFIFLVLSLFVFVPTVSATTTYDVCTVTLVETNDKNVELTWNTIDGAETYEIYKKQDDSETYIKIATTQATSYVDESVSEETTYTYYVLPLDETGSTNWSYKTATVRINSVWEDIVGIVATFVFCIIFALIIISLISYLKTHR